MWAQGKHRGCLESCGIFSYVKEKTWHNCTRPRSSICRCCWVVLVCFALSVRAALTQTWGLQWKTHGIVWSRNGTLKQRSLHSKEFHNDYREIIWGTTRIGSHPPKKKKKKSLEGVARDLFFLLRSLAFGWNWLLPGLLEHKLTYNSFRWEY